MLAERWIEWEQQWKQEGRREGIQEGRQEGRQEGKREGMQEGRREGIQEGLQQGEARILLRLLERKFGPLPKPVADQVLSADADTLLSWSERVLTAATLEDVVQNDGGPAAD
ncbi:MAG: DUF4351 domain-containing protein [Candidatus Methylumidiphilus sp.]